MRWGPLLCALITGCVHSYTLQQSTAEQLILLEGDPLFRKAVLAATDSAGQRAWIMNRHVRFDDAPPVNGRIRATSRSAHASLVVGSILMIYSTGYLGAGGFLLDNINRIDRSYVPQCKARGGWFCGWAEDLTADYDKAGGTVLLTVGSLLMLSSVVMMIMGSERDGARINANKPGWTYLK
jgi:hypothetical protein